MWPFLSIKCTVIDLVYQEWNFGLNGLCNFRSTSIISKIKMKDFKTYFSTENKGICKPYT